MSKRPRWNHAPAMALAAIKGEKTLADLTPQFLSRQTSAFH
ncbi:hypothetical protein [Methylocapsa palsarum]|nr:hypothetical protein [Methylocapsa palsarum]